MIFDPYRRRDRRRGTSFNSVHRRLVPRRGTRGIADIVKQAKQDGVEWVLIDTPPNMSATVTDAIRCATLVVVPARPGVFDIDAVKETIDFSRQLRKPYAVVINAAPPRREE